MLENSKKFQPKETQLAFLEAYLSQEVRMSIEQLAEIAGITAKTYYEWVKNPDFNKWFYEQIEVNKHRFAPRILDNLFNLARQTTDKGVIELALKVLDLYTPTNKQINENINITDDTLNKVLENAKKLITVDN